MRRQQRQSTDEKTAGDGLQRDRETAALEDGFHKGDAAHDGDADGGAGERQDEERSEIDRRDPPRQREMADEIGVDPERARGDDGADRRGDDRREAKGRIRPDDKFESVEGARQRRLKGGGNSARGAAADERAHIRAAHLE